MGVGTIDLGGFQDVDTRSYEEKQRQPGDWVTQMSQGPIAIHAREHLGSTDAGVVTWRRLVQRAVRGENTLAVPPGLSGTESAMWSHAGDAVSGHSPPGRG